MPEATSALAPLPTGVPSVPSAGLTALFAALSSAALAPRRWLAAARTPCATCGLLSDGFADPVVRGLHFCARRAEALADGLREALPSDALASREVLAGLDARTLGGLGRVGSAFLAEGAGYRRVRWDEIAAFVAGARAPWWIPGPGLSLEAHLAARAVFGDGREPVGRAAAVLAAASGSALAPMPSSALRRAGWIVVAAARGVDPDERFPVLRRWLAAARGTVTAIGAPVAGAGERVPVGAAAVGPLLAAVTGRRAPERGAPEAEIEHLARRLRAGPGVLVIDADPDDDDLARSALALAAARPPGPGHGWLWLWDVLPPPFDAPTAPAPADPDLVILHGPPPPALAERIRRAPRRLHLVSTLDPSVAWPGPAAILPARPLWEQEGASGWGLDRRARFVPAPAVEPPGESRDDVALLAFLARALGRASPADAAEVRRETAGDPRYAGWSSFARAGDHALLGGPFLRGIAG